MAFSRKQAQQAASVSNKSILASAAIYPVENFSWRNFRFNDSAWQSELWRLYDAIAQYRFLVDWVGAACGRVRVYAADVDVQGNIQQETKNLKVLEVANNLLGGEESKSECIRAMAINLEVAGEVWVIGRPNTVTDADEWMVVSNVELRRNKGFIYLGVGDEKIQLVEGQDLLIRIWTPHPRWMLLPESPSRAVYPILIMLEKLEQYIFTQLNSRLASGGVWVLPDNIDWPEDDSEASGTADTFTKRFLELAEANIKNPGTAGGMAPMIIEAPPELFDKIKPPLIWDTQLSEQAITLRKEALNNLAVGMDTPPEVMVGTSGSNHWGAWHVDESTIKSVIEPLMNRMLDGLNKAYFYPILKTMGLDPKKFTLTYDTSPLNVRPQRLQDTLNLNKEGIASDAAVLRAGDYKETDGPDQAEKDMKFARLALQNNPLLWTNSDVLEMAQLPDAVVKAAKAGMQMVSPTGQSLGAPPPPPAPPNKIIDHKVTPIIPRNSTAKGAPMKDAAAVAASAHVDEIDEAMRSMAILVAADLTMKRALERANGRLLKPGVRGTIAAGIPAIDFHVHVVAPISRVDAQRHLLDGWTHLPGALDSVGATVDNDLLQSVLYDHAVDLMTTKARYDARALADVLAEKGLVHAGR